MSNPHACRAWVLTDADGPAISACCGTSQVQARRCGTSAGYDLVEVAVTMESEPTFRVLVGASRHLSGDEVFLSANRRGSNQKCSRFFRTSAFDRASPRH